MSARSVAAWPVLVDRFRVSIEPVEAAYLLSVMLAPLNLGLFHALTAYDVATGLVAILIIAAGRRLHPIPRSMRLAALLLILAGLVSAFRATYPLQAVGQLLQYSFIFFIQLPVILTLVRSRSMLEASLAMLLIGYVLMVAMAMLSGPGHVAGRVTPLSTDNPNALGVPAAFIAPFAAYFVTELWRRHQGIAAVVSGAAMTAAILWAIAASGSRGAAASSLASMAVFIVFYRRSEPWKMLLRLGAFFAAVGIAVILIANTHLLPATLGTRVEGTLHAGSQQTGSAIVDDRVALDLAALREFETSPLIGTGFDNFRYVSQFYGDDASFHDPHDLLLQFLTQSGLVGGVAFVFLVVRWFLLLFRTQAAAELPETRAMACAFIASFIGILTVGIATPLVPQRQYWFVYGLGLAACVVAWRTGGLRRFAPVAAGVGEGVAE
jgi:O-antigen ligase